MADRRAPRISTPSRGGVRHSTEERISNHQRGALARLWGLQPQQVAPARQIANGVTLDQIPILFIHQSGERHKVERTIGRDQQTAYFARFRPQRRPYRPHDHLIHCARQSFDVRAVFAQRLAPGVYGPIDRRSGAEVHPLRAPLRRKQIDEVARRAGSEDWTAESVTGCACARNSAQWAPSSDSRFSIFSSSGLSRIRYVSRLDASDSLRMSEANFERASMS